MIITDDTTICIMHHHQDFSAADFAAAREILSHLTNRPDDPALVESVRSLLVHLQCLVIAEVCLCYPSLVPFLERPSAPCPKPN